MLYIQSFTYNPFQENTYLICNDKKECWIVDPGMYEPSEITQFKKHIESNNLHPQAIINTHAHIDHILGVQALIDAYHLPFAIHEKDLPVLNNATASAMFFGFSFTNIPVVNFYIKEGEPLMLGSDMLEVRFVPGHSPGSILFYYEKGDWAINGDVLFNESIGRTDLPGGNYDTLIQSIRTQVLTLPDHTTIYSGHGPSTKIGHEKKYNPFLKDSV